MQQNIKVAQLPTNKENTFIKVTASYRKGGPNMWTGAHERRGIEVCVTPVEVKTYDDGVQISTTSAFSGARALLEETKRFSQKQLDAWADKVLSTDLYQDVLADVVYKNNLTLVEATA